MFKGGLRRKLVLFFLIFSLGPLFFLFFSLFISFQNHLTQAYNSQLLSIANTVAKSIDAWGQRKVDQVSAGRDPNALQSFYINDKGEGSDNTGAKLNLGDDSYFRQMLDTARPTFSHFYRDGKTGKKVVRIFVPQIVNEKLIGSLGMVVSVEDLERFITSVRVGEKGFVTLVDSRGYFAIHPDEGKVLQERVEDRSVLLGEKLRKEMEGWHHEKQSDGEYLLAFSQASLCGWQVVAEISAQEAYAGLSHLRRFILWVIVAIGVGVTLLSLWISGMISFGITRMTHVVKKVAAGDLRIRLAEMEAMRKNLKDEVGVLAEVFIRMIDNLQRLVGKMVDVASQLTAVSTEVSRSVEEIGQANREIAQAVAQIAEGSNHQSDDLREVSERAEEMAQKAEGMNQSTQKNIARLEEMKTNLQRNSESLAEIKRAIAVVEKEGRDTEKEAQGGQEVLQLLIRNISSVSEVAEEAGQAIAALNERSQEIGKIVDIITTIAEQTNLLALNAAIEAARAGEAGRGFAVVAEEVRKLAENSAQAAQQISTLIGEIQKDTTRAVEKVREAQKRVGRGVEQSEEAVLGFTRIVQAIGRVMESTKALVSTFEMAEKAQEITERDEDEIMAFSLENMKLIEGVSQSVRFVSETLSSIAMVAGENAASSEEVSASVEELNASLEGLKETTKVLSEWAKNLHDLVGQFQV